MEAIKTYHKVNREDHNKRFGLSKMEAIYDKRKGEVDEPHRHDFFTVILVERAKGIHNIDFKEYPLLGSEVFFISPGQVHQIIEHEKSFGYSIVFSNDFLIENNIPRDFIDDLNLFQDYGVSPSIKLDQTQFNALANYCNAIQQELVHCLLYTSDAADDSLRVDLGGRRIIKKGPDVYPDDLLSPDG